MTFLYKIVHSIVDVDKQSYVQLSKETRTRNSHKFKLQVPISTKNVFKYYFFVRTARDWNKLPLDIATSTTLEKFKKVHEIFFISFIYLIILLLSILFFILYIAF